MTAPAYNGQVHQDRFVLHMLGGKTDGTYLEIGASHPITLSNTYTLEQLGWTGLSLELDPVYKELWPTVRKNPLVMADATRYDFYPGLPKRINYLSCDIAPPSATFIALARAIEHTRYDVVTYETDEYSDPRFVVPSRELMKAYGYTLVKPGVLSIYGPFEDWYVDATTVDVSLAATF